MYCQCGSYNMCKSDSSLQGRTVLGRLEPVRSVTPLEVKLVQKEERRSQSDAEGTNST